MRTRPILIGFVVLCVVALTGVAHASVIQDAEEYRHTDIIFGSFDGVYDVRNGITIIDGTYKYGKNYNQLFDGIGGLKYFDWDDSSMPNCKRAYMDNFFLLLDKANRFGRGGSSQYATADMEGKLCDMNWNGRWKSFKGTFDILDGRADKDTKVSGDGIISFLIDTKTGKILQGKFYGWLTLSE